MLTRSISLYVKYNHVYNAMNSIVSYMCIHNNTWKSLVMSSGAIVQAKVKLNALLIKGAICCRNGAEHDGNYATNE